MFLYELEPTDVGSNSYKNIDEDENKKEFQMGRFLNEINAWDIGLSVANELNLTINKDELNKQKEEALLTYWSK